MSVTVMGHVWASDLPPHLKLVLLAYADHANDDGTSIYPGEDWMAAKTSYTKGTIRRNTKALLDEGYLEQVKRGYRGQRAEYRVNVPKVKASHIDTLSNASHLTTESLTSEAESLSSDDVMPSAHATPNVIEPSEPSENHHLATIAKLEHDAIWDTAVELYGQPTKSQTSLHAKLVNELVEYDATPSEMRRRSVLLVQDWGKKAATLASLAKWWYRYDGQVAQVTDTQVEESVREQTREERRAAMMAGIAAIVPLDPDSPQAIGRRKAASR